MKGAIPDETLSQSGLSVNTPKSDILYIVFVAVCLPRWVEASSSTPFCRRKIRYFQNGMTAMEKATETAALQAHRLTDLQTAFIIKEPSEPVKGPYLWIKPK